MASITITTNPEQDARLQPAFSNLLNVENATPAQVKAWLIEQMRGIVITYETKLAIEALQPPNNFNPD